MVLPDEGGLIVAVYSAAPGSATEDALKLLASWCATTAAENAQAADAEVDSGN